MQKDSNVSSSYCPVFQKRVVKDGLKGGWIEAIKTKSGPSSRFAVMLCVYTKVPNGNATCLTFSTTPTSTARVTRIASCALTLTMTATKSLSSRSAEPRVSEDSAARIAVADFDGDGKLDFATIANNPAAFHNALH
ncbi:hypothetical protein BC937DRAFT_87448 [Endogone sp. FLAS-F59071]|nr:hypothetical protein BC937DRAFT_87448 [Endogone sp. FLAS-F59071]|eukprot:RUS19452.1 hypothetical protein BC937DRAFT_87448 [Endogone sp. FLAS-F59071]